MNFDPQRKVFLPLKTVSKQKILAREKWTTLRTFPDARVLGLEVGESAFIDVDGTEFVLTNLGPKTVAEAGGKDAVWVSEGFEKHGPSFPHVERWLDGYQRLFMYTIYTRLEWDLVKKQIRASVSQGSIT